MIVTNELGTPALNTVHHCRAEALLSALDTTSVDLVVTSPPYDNLRTYNGFSWSFEYIAQQTYRVLKPGGVLVWVVGDATIDGSESLTSFKQVLYFKEQVGFRVHDTMIWHKSPAQYGKFNRYTPAFEYMFVLSKGKPKTFDPVRVANPNAGVVERKRRTGDDGWKDVPTSHITKQDTVLDNVWKMNVGFWHSATDDLAYDHPAIFPETLAERHILTWSNPGDVVLDYFGGSGTTAKMARKNGRDYLTCDISLDYCDLMRRRLAQPYTPMFAELVS